MINMNFPRLLAVLAIISLPFAAQGSSLGPRNSSAAANQSDVEATKVLQEIMKSFKSSLAGAFGKGGSKKNVPNGLPKQSRSHLSLFSFDEVPGYKAAVLVDLSVEPAKQRKRCEPGSSSEQNRTECSKCPEGTFSQGGLDTCKLCPPGTTSELGATACNNCSAGTFCIAGNASESCPAGSWSPPGASSCTLCPAGQWSKTKAESCSKCKAGTFSAEGAGACIACSAGSFSDKDGAAKCEICPAGTYAPKSSTKCTKCPKGHYSSKAGSAECTTCSAGSFSDKDGASKCEICPAGTYAPKSSTKCIECPKGHYSSKAESSECSPCSPGTYSSMTGATRCKVCDLNFNLYHRSGMDKCDACPNGGATRNSSSCYRKANITCINKLFFRNYGAGNGSDMCAKTIDNNVNTYGTSFVALNNVYSHPRTDKYATYFVYTFDPAVNVRRVVIWHRVGCCVEELKHLTIRYLGIREQYWMGGHECQVTGTQEAALSTDSYRYISHCERDDVESIYVEPSKNKHVFYISELAVYIQ